MASPAVVRSLERVRTPHPSAEKQLGKHERHNSEQREDRGQDDEPAFAAEDGDESGDSARDPAQECESSSARGEGPYEAEEDEDQGESESPAAQFRRG